MSFQTAPSMRTPEAGPAWKPYATSERAYAGLLAGATVTGEAARQDLSIRVGLWLDEVGLVRRARWHTSGDRALRATADAACALLEGGGDPARLAEALRAGGHDERGDFVASAVEAAMLLAPSAR